MIGNLSSTQTSPLFFLQPRCGLTSYGPIFYSTNGLHIKDSCRHYLVQTFTTLIGGLSRIAIVLPSLIE